MGLKAGNKKTEVPSHLVPYLEEMELELRGKKRSVKRAADSRLTAIDDSRYVWVRERENPKWWTEIRKKFPRNRKARKNREGRVLNKKGQPLSKSISRYVRPHDSRLERCRVWHIFRQLINKGWSYSEFAWALVEEAERRHEEDPERFTITESYAQWYFNRQFGIQLTVEEAERVEQLYDQSEWDHLAEVYKINGKLPDVVDDDDVPF